MGFLTSRNELKGAFVHKKNILFSRRLIINNEGAVVLSPESQTERHESAEETLSFNSS